MARPSKKRKAPGCVVTGLVIAGLLSVAFYLLLASGSMGGLIHFIVLKATAVNPEAVHVYGGSSDLFTYIRADSVVVVNDLGLRVAVFGADVKGSAFDYLVRSDVECVFVDSVIIHTPEPSEEPSDSSLAPIFLGTLDGMVTRTDTISVSYGRVVDPDGLVLVDSMRLNARIVDIENVELDIREASAFIPLFGSSRASGTLFIDSTSTSLDDFHVDCPPGSFQVYCGLNADSTFSLSFTGVASTAFIPEAPPATAVITGHGAGSIMDPLVLFTLSEGKLDFPGISFELSADSIISSREECSVHGLVVSTGGAFGNVSGGLHFSDMAWNGTILGSMYGVDLSNYFAELPYTEISGSFNLSGSGTKAYLDNGYARCELLSSRVSDHPLSSLILDCQVNQRELSGSLQADLGGGTVSSRFSTSLGLNFEPVAWDAQLEASLENCAVLAVLADPAFENACRLTARVDCQGSRSAFSAQGDLGLGLFSSNDLHIRNAVFSGALSSGASGMLVDGEITVDSVAFSNSIQMVAGGIHADLCASGRNASDLEASGILDMDSFQYNMLTGEFLSFTGDVSVDSEGIDGRGRLSADSIILAGASYSLSSVFIAEPGIFHLDSLSIGAPGDLVLDLAGHFRYGVDSLAFSMDGIALTRAGKLRLISEGDLEFVSDSAGMTLDTLWLDLPSGEIAADGWMRGDSIKASAVLSGVDIASFTTMLGLRVPFSGILEAEFSSSGEIGNLQTVLSADIQHPTYDEWDRSDSLTIDIHTMADSLVVDGIWSWSNGVRSGFRIAMDQIWDSDRRLSIEISDIVWLETELTGIGDELFYLLPMPFKTNGASVSARVEYQRDTAELSAGIASHFDRLYLTDPGIEFPGISLYLTYPDQQAGDMYNGRVTLNSGEGQLATLHSILLLDIVENLPFTEGSIPLELNGFDFSADFNRWETLIAGIGWLQISGSLYSQSDDLQEKPGISGKLTIDQATISMGGGGTLEGSGGRVSGTQDELPLDLNIRISGDRGIWFRNSYANVELSVAVDITTVRGQILLGGDIKAVRGGVYLLGREFQITQGEARILQTDPLGIEVDIRSETRIRSSVSSAEYIIIVTVTGDPDEPEITLTGSGPSGAITEQDIVTLLTTGMTYGELQQFDSRVLGNVAGSYLGSWLARSIRDDVGLDALNFTPDFSSDSTSLVVNAGKYVLPDLFVSYSSDVFSSDAGTLKAQYFFNRDFFLEGSAKSTFTGNQDPSLELHYTYRY
ncbi:MAG: translocation/assembly module TamB domain-containing protein [Candidatus Sabulitectum sp.]|nr:translocation/assembly module TamB domain-containing protein [Candidatus Sabulitectum sp.]